MLSVRFNLIRYKCGRISELEVGWNREGFKRSGEVCKGVAPRSIRDSPPAAATIFPKP